MITNLLSAMTMTKPGMVTITSYGNINYYHFNHEFTEGTKGKSKGNHPIRVSNLTIEFILAYSYSVIIVIHEMHVLSLHVHAHVKFYWLLSASYNFISSMTSWCMVPLLIM